MDKIKKDRHKKYDCDYEPYPCVDRKKCDELLEEIDLALTKARVFYGEADNLRDQLIKMIQEAIVVANKVNEANSEGDNILLPALDKVKKNPCSKPCNTIPDKCQRIFDDGLDEIRREKVAMDKAIVALRDALFQVEESKYFDELGDAIFREFFECIGVR